MPQRIYVELDRRRVAAEVHFNGWPVIHAGRQGLIRAAIAAEEFVIDGENTLTLWVEPNPSASRWQEAHPVEVASDAQAVARVVAYPPDVEPDPANGEILASVMWSPQEGDVQLFPASRSARLIRRSSRWGWEAAPLLTLGPPLVHEAHQVLQALQRAIDAADLSAIESLLAVKIGDAMRAYPVYTMPMVREGWREFLADLQRSPRGPSEALRPEHHAMRLIAGGHALECIDDDFSPCLKVFDEDGDRIPYEVRLARLDGMLRVVR